MVWNLPELSLDLSPPAAEPPLPDFLTKFSITSDELSRLEEFINGLEDELKKIRAFQRELPLSSLLLNDAIEKLKEKARINEERRKSGEDGKLSESVGVKLVNDVSDKKTWMSSAQLWSPTVEESRKSEGGVVPSFTKDDVKSPCPNLSLVVTTPVVVEPAPKKLRTGPGPNQHKLGVVDQMIKPQSRPGCHSVRKQRRCWSAELHKRFVDALEKLGGSQVATPKQIRELMQVEGLTNDEVKSHLQKYRLHVRKVPAGSTRTASSTDEEMCGDQLELGCSNMDMMHSDSPEGPLHLEASRKCNSSIVEDDEEENSDGHSWKVQRHVMVS